MNRFSEYWKDLCDGSASALKIWGIVIAGLLLFPLLVVVVPFAGIVGLFRK